jgi:predicted amidohydrolase
MNVCLIPFPTEESPKKNIEKLLEHIPCGADFCLLPELWNCVYENRHIAAAAGFCQAAFDAMAFAAKTRRTWLAGTIPFLEDGRIYNRALVFDDFGSLVTSYDKSHLLEVHARRDYAEKEVFTPGSGLCVFDTPWGRCGLVICYDIRFPELARLLAMQDIFCLFVPAAFNAQVGQVQWQPLMQARAIENEMYVCACNPDYTFEGYTSWGHSMIVDPFGKILEGTRADIHASRVDEIRRRMPVWDIRRNDMYRLEEL